MRLKYLLLALPVVIITPILFTISCKKDSGEVLDIDKIDNVVAEDAQETKFTFAYNDFYAEYIKNEYVYIYANGVDNKPVDEMYYSQNGISFTIGGGDLIKSTKLKK
jgi:hypothetical protein